MTRMRFLKPTTFVFAENPIVVLDDSPDENETGDRPEGMTHSLYIEYIAIEVKNPDGSVERVYTVPEDERGKLDHHKGRAIHSIREWCFIVKKTGNVLLVKTDKGLVYNLVSETALPDTLTNEPEKENIQTLNTTLFYGAKVAIATGAFQNPTAEEKWPHAPIKRQRVKALAIMRPTDKDLQDPEEFLEESALRLWQEKMTAEVKKMNDETADILDGVISIYLDKAKDPGDGVWVKAKELLRMRGIRPHAKRGFKTEDKKRVAMSIHRLAHLFIRVYEAEWEGIVERDGKEKKVHRTGKVDWNDGKRFIEAEILHVEGRAGVELLWGEVEYDAWFISLGKQLAPFILGPGKQMALLSRKTLEFDPMRQKYEKRLTRYLSWIWRIRAAAGDLLQPFKMRTLCEEIKLEDMKRKPGVRVARMEKALDALQDAGIIATWQYEDGWEPTGNHTKWLDARVIIEPAEIHKTQAEKIVRPEGKPKAKAAIPPGTFDPARLRAFRLNRNLTQLQAVEELQALIEKRRVKARLSRTLYVFIEGGKRKPSAPLEKILSDWVGGNV